MRLKRINFDVMRKPSKNTPTSTGEEVKPEFGEAPNWRGLVMGHCGDFLIKDLYVTMTGQVIA